MGEWIDLPVLVDDEPIRVDLFQDIWENLYNLKNLRYAEKSFLSPAGSYTTVSTTFVDVDAVNVAIDFESFGGDLLVGLNIAQGNASTNAGAKFRFTLDGTPYGNADGLMNMQDYGATQFDTYQLLHWLLNVPAGEHTLVLQFAVGPSNGGTVRIYSSLGEKRTLWVLETQ